MPLFGKHPSVLRALVETGRPTPCPELPILSRRPSDPPGQNVAQHGSNPPPVDTERWGQGLSRPWASSQLYEQAARTFLSPKPLLRATAQGWEGAPDQLMEGKGLILRGMGGCVGPA